MIMYINERIRHVRQSLGLTQTNFGKRIAVSTSYLAGMELGTKKVNERTIRLIAMEYNIDEHWLKTGEGTMYNTESDATVIKATSLFRSLSYRCRECALVQLSALVELDNSIDEK